MEALKNSLRVYHFNYLSFFRSYETERKELELVTVFPCGPENPLAAVEVLGAILKALS